MSIDIYIRWVGQTEQENETSGYEQGSAASQFLFTECWSAEDRERMRKILAGEPVEPRKALLIDTEALPNGDEENDQRSFINEDLTGVQQEEQKWKPFPISLLRSRERTARRHIWELARRYTAEEGSNDAEEVHARFLEVWLPHKRLMKLAADKESKTGAPVEIRISQQTARAAGKEKAMTEPGTDSTKATAARDEDSRATPEQGCDRKAASATNDAGADPTRRALLAEGERLIERAQQHERDNRPDLAELDRSKAQQVRMEATNHPTVDTGRTDDLGRTVRVDQFGRRVWSNADWNKPPHLTHLTADQWYRMRQCHGPVSCG